MKPGIADDMRLRIEAGALRLPVHERTELIERLVVAHESYDEIMASWDDEIARRIEEVDSGRVKLIPMEETMAKLRAMIAQAPRREPRIPSGIEEVEDHALHLPDDDFCLLLVGLEGALPEQVDPVWRADIQRRIAAIPAEFERRNRYDNGGCVEDE
ncbi:MAG TPA: addiction module protein [Longimicrobium sp.]|nr:addiction module protein [Longimicrobium sp.]